MNYDQGKRRRETNKERAKKKKSNVCEKKEEEIRGSRKKGERKRAECEEVFQVFVMIYSLWIKKI